MGTISFQFDHVFLGKFCLGRRSLHRSGAELDLGRVVDPGLLETFQRTKGDKAGAFVFGEEKFAADVDALVSEEECRDLAEPIYDH